MAFCSVRRQEVQLEAVSFTFCSQLMGTSNVYAQQATYKQMKILYRNYCLYEIHVSVLQILRIITVINI